MLVQGRIVEPEGDERRVGFEVHRGGPDRVLEHADARDTVERRPEE
jgi:hypothetical protein